MRDEMRGQSSHYRSEVFFIYNVFDDVIVKNMTSR